MKNYFSINLEVRLCYSFYMTCFDEVQVLLYCLKFTDPHARVWSEVGFCLGMGPRYVSGMNLQGFGVSA